MIRRLFAFLKKPPAALLPALWAVTAALVAGDMILLAAGYEKWPAYVVFALSAALLAYSVYTLIAFAPEVKKRAVRRLSENAFFRRLIESYGFRTAVFFLVSFAVDVAFALFDGVMGIVTASVWYGVIAVYYLFLSALRGGILLLSRRAAKRSGGAAPDEREKLKIYRLCGALLLVLEIALLGAVTLMVRQGKPMNYSKIMAIAMAAYTFYKVILAVYNAFRVRKLRDPVLQCFRNINLTDAAVSLLSLQVTLVAVFSEGDALLYATAMNATTGFVVCALTIALGLAMIFRGHAALKKLGERTDEQRE